MTNTIQLSTTHKTHDFLSRLNQEQKLELNKDNLMYEVVENTTDENEITHAIFEMPLTFKFNDYILIVLNLFVKTNKDLVISEIMFEEYNSFSA